jgi:hypothetical protein
LKIKLYLAEGVSEGGTGDTGADDDDVGAGDVNGTAFSVGGALFRAFFWEILLLCRSFIAMGIAIATESVEKKEPEKRGKEGPEHVLIDHNHFLPQNGTMEPRRRRRRRRRRTMGWDQKLSFSLYLSGNDGSCFGSSGRYGA